MNRHLLPAILGVAVTFACPTSRCGERAWPTIAPVHQRTPFVVDAATPRDYVLLLEDAAGVPRYRLECHAGEYESGTQEINYSGTFHCALFAVEGGKTTSWNLLASETKDEQSSDWFNRGRMLDRQLFGDCGEYREYGRVRRFALRGMAITFTDLAWGDEVKDGVPFLKRFTFDVNVTPDPSATTEAAATVKTPRPPARCAW